MKINIVNYSTGSHFDEIIDSLTSALYAHCDVTRVDTPRSTGLNIIFGANVLALREERIVFPPNTLIYNLEQLGHNSLWDSTFYLDYLLAYPTIDYSKSNIKYMLSHGKKSETLFLPIRHSDSFNDRIPFRRHRDIDVAIIGALSPRRELLAKNMQRSGLTVAYATDCWGDNRKALLARSKVVVNVRSNDTGLLESTRLVSLISSGVACISESSSDKDEDEFFAQWIQIVEYGKLAQAAEQFVRAYREDAIAIPAPANSKYFKEDYQFYVDKIAPKILAANQVSQEMISKISVQDLIAQGLYLSARNKILSTPGHDEASLIPAIDYILGQHDRIHDVVDSIGFAENPSLARIAIYLELVLKKWMPDELIAEIRRLTLPYLVSLQLTEGTLPEYLQRLVLRYLARLNEVYLFLKFIPTSASLLDYALSLLCEIQVPRVVWDDAASLLRTVERINLEVRLHVAAEIYWKTEQTDAAAIAYAEAKRMGGLRAAHYTNVGERLKRFGDHILAQVYFEKGSPAGDIENAQQSLAQANTCVSPMIPKIDLGKLAFALERSTSSKVYVKPAIGAETASFFVGGNTSQTTAAIDGDIRVFDKKLTSLAAKPAKAVGIIACYNEIDVIEAAIRSMVANNLQVHIIDNWSNDGTYELLQILQDELGFALERFPADGPAATYDWTGLLARKEEVAMLYQGYWIVHGDADEIRISPWRNIDLASAFSVAERYGSNAIDYLILNFRPIDDGYVAGLDLEKYFRFYEIASSNDLRYQIKSWKQGDTKVDLVGRGGHYVQFDGMKVFPYKFICKHYPLRSVQHASKKINFDRIARFSPEERAKGWHSHYDNVDPATILRSSLSLQQWNCDSLHALSPHLIQGT